MFTQMDRLKANTIYFDGKILSMDASIRLFCFPYAGGSAAIYHHWPQLIHPKLVVCPAHLPGRGRRFSERPIEQVDCLINELLVAIIPYIDKPYAFFGHSMGALVAYELAHKISKAGFRQPEHLIVSGKQAPHLSRNKHNLHHLPEAAFKEELKQLNGTPQEVLDSVELMELMLPLLRADFKLVETYQYNHSTPLTMPITAFTGVDDVDIPVSDIIDWKVHTHNDFKYYELPGDHFFINKAGGEICEIINKIIKVR